MAQEAVIKIEDFKGINAGDPELIGDTEAVECINWEIDTDGIMRKRWGIEQVGTITVDVPTGARLLGYFKVGSYQVLLAVSDGLWFSRDGEDWTAVVDGDGFVTEGGTPWAVQYRDKIYVGAYFGMLQITATAGPTLTAVEISGAPGGIVGLVHKDRLFVAKGQGSNPARLYFSLEGSSVTAGGEFGAAAWVSTNFIDINPIDGDSLSGLGVINDVLVVFKFNSTFGLYVQGIDPFTDWTVRLLHATIGAYGIFSIKLVENYLYFTSADGVYRTDGTGFKRISDDLQNRFWKRGRNPGRAGLNEFAIQWNDFILFSYYPGTGFDDTICQYLVYYFRKDIWVQWIFTQAVNPDPEGTYWSVLPTTAILVTDPFFEGGIGIYGGTAGDGIGSGEIIRWGLTEQYTDLEATYQVRWLSKLWCFDDPVKSKRGKWSALSGRWEDDLDFTYLIDNEAFEVALTLDPAEGTRKIQGPGYFRNIQIDLQSNTDSIVYLRGLHFIVSSHRKMINSY